MIRVRKTEVTPTSLTRENSNSYDGQDVQKQLVDDQYCKCFICERRVPVDYEIEHLRPQKSFPDLRFEWTNLFLSCSFCNDKKKHFFTHIVRPNEKNIEEEIEQRIDFYSKTILLKTENDSSEYEETIALLDCVLNNVKNGKAKIRTIKEQKFFQLIANEMERFYVHVNAYMNNKTGENKQAIKDCLLVDEQYLGLKYWIIKDNPFLYEQCKDSIVWNKTQEDLV